jgi:formylglycine-generating enzyme required for sulfatase activity
MELYYGLDSTLALNLSVWDRNWGDQPSKTFNLIPQTLLWQTNYPGGPPVITSQPQDHQEQAGSTVVFSVQASGGVPMACRWMRDGLCLSDNGRITGTIGTTLTIGNLSSNDAGNYSVSIVNEWGFANSRLAALTLPPTAPPQMVWISPGTFVMGSPASEAKRLMDEAQYTVIISKGFYMGKYLVTQADYQAVMRSNPSYNGGNPNNPVERVSWNDAVAYCVALTQQQQAAGKLPGGWAYRLPTEAEWEYACRAGTTTAFYFGNAIHGGMANFDSHYEYDASNGDIYKSNPVGYVGQTTPVGSYAPNPWGLFDMCGNVWEWCQDWYDAYPTGSVTDPVGPASGSSRVLRGGCWRDLGWCCRAAFRRDNWPGDKFNLMGFRPVLAPGH